MPTADTFDLPPAVAANIDACNAHDIDAWMATFTPDALINDFQREFAGAPAIRAFAQKELFDADVTMDVERAVDRRGDVALDARIDGTYDKTGLPDPLILSFYYTVRDGLISQLIIIHNKPPA